MIELLTPVADTIRRAGFAFVEAPEMGVLLEKAGLSDWQSFAASWDDLGVDAYMADGGRYRRRRFAAFRGELAGLKWPGTSKHLTSNRPITCGQPTLIAPVRSGESSRFG